MKLMQFLMGLDDSYMQLRSNILSRDPLPDAKGAYVLISSEESHIAVVTGSGAGPSQRDQSSIFTSSVNNRSVVQRSQTFGNTPRPNNAPRPNNNRNRRIVGGPTMVCEHCGFNGHTMDRIKVSHPNGIKALITKDLMDVKIMGIGKQVNGLYYFNSTEGNVFKSGVVSSNLTRLNWHKRLGHPSDQVLTVLKYDLFLNNNNTDNIPCDICQKAKQTREPFPFIEHKSIVLGELMHLDLWGPYRIVSKEGHSLVKNQFKQTIKTFRSDNGTEFINDKFNGFCENNGIIHQTSCSYTPQQKGILERKHSHLLNIARSLLFKGGIPLNLWSDYVLMACYLINRFPVQC
ncbi:putative RNA-directed DNA polymerase [Tanacetum coccineum]